MSNTIEQLEGHDLYFELGEKSVFQGSFKSVGLPDVRNTVFNIELHQAHLGPEDLAAVYLPWFDMNYSCSWPLYRLPYLDFEQIHFDGTLSDFLVRAKSVTPALAGNLSFVYGPCGGGAPECDTMRGDFKFDRIDFRKFTDLSFLRNGVVSGTYAGIWDQYGPSFHVNSRLHRLNHNQGQFVEPEVAMTWENNQLDHDRFC